MKSVNLHNVVTVCSQNDTVKLNQIIETKCLMIDDNRKLNDAEGRTLDDLPNTRDKYVAAPEENLESRIKFKLNSIFNLNSYCLQDIAWDFINRSHNHFISKLV